MPEMTGIQNTVTWHSPERAIPDASQRTRRILFVLRSRLPIVHVGWFNRTGFLTLDARRVDGKKIRWWCYLPEIPK